MSILSHFNEYGATDKRPDYKEVSRVYKSFWTTCEDAYLFKLDDKKEIDISQLLEPPATFNIRSKENRIVKELVNWLLNMPRQKHEANTLRDASRFQ